MVFARAYGLEVSVGPSSVGEDSFQADYDGAITNLEVEFGEDTDGDFEVALYVNSEKVAPSTATRDGFRRTKAGDLNTRLHAAVMKGDTVLLRGLNRDAALTFTARANLEVTSGPDEIVATTPAPSVPRAYAAGPFLPWL